MEIKLNEKSIPVERKRKFSHFRVELYYKSEDTKEGYTDYKSRTLSERNRRDVTEVKVREKVEEMAEEILKKHESVEFKGIDVIERSNVWSTPYGFRWGNGSD